MKRTKEILDAQGTPEVKALHQAICLDAAENLDANLVSIWGFNEQRTKIICLHALDVETGENSEGAELSRAEFPHYFETILQETMISAPDAQTHPETKELTDSYFVPNEIVSLLDFIVHQDFAPVGILCCESRRKRRVWCEADRRYVRRLAALASFRATVC